MEEALRNAGRDRFIVSGGREGQRVGNDSVRQRVPILAPRTR